MGMIPHSLRSGERHRISSFAGSTEGRREWRVWVIIHTMLWVKSFHIIFVISWFAGLFYLPRLFVWHAMTEDHAGSERFKLMERKLYRGIMSPCMGLTLLFGGWMVWLNPVYLQIGWMHAKLALVALLLVYHFMCRHYLILFRNDRNTHTHLYYRWFNEVPTVLLIAIVILVVVKPF